MRLSNILVVAAALTLAAPAAAQYQPGRGITETNREPVDTVAKSSAVDRGALIGTTAVTVAPADTTRRGFAMQVQSTTSTCYVASGTATTDFHSLQVAPGGYYETPPTHVGVGALSVICTAASTPVYFRTW